MDMPVNSIAEDSGEITLAKLQAAFDATKQFQPTELGPGAYRMNSCTREKLEAMCSPAEPKIVPSSCVLGPITGIEILIDETLADDVCQPSLTAAQMRAEARRWAEMPLPRSFPVKELL